MGGFRANTHRSLLLGSAIIAAYGPALTRPAVAADTSQAGPRVEEITVTATKRSERASKVPISIVALGAKSLARSGIKTVADLGGKVPGLQFDEASGFGPGTVTNIAIRGINSLIGMSTTGVYLDDTAIQTRANPLTFWGNPLPLISDLDRVEVLRGPQGTLFGAGAEGGALRFITQQPSLTKFSGTARAGVEATANGDPSGEAGLAYGGPLVEDKLGFRISGWLRHQGGYVDRADPITGKIIDPNANANDAWNWHLAFTAQPTEWLTITPAFYQQGTDNHDSSAWYEDLSKPDDGKFVNGRLLQQPSEDHFWMPSLKWEADLGDMRLTSITSYFRRGGSLTNDFTNYLGAIIYRSVPFSYGDPRGPEYPTNYNQASPTFLTTKVSTINQEIRLASADQDARLRWTLGAFYSHAKQTDTEDVTSPYWLNRLFIPFLHATPGEPLYYSSLESEDTQVAAFGQADFKITEQLTATAGLRLAYDKTSYIQDQYGAEPSPITGISSGEFQERPVTPMVKLAYQINPTWMVYAGAGKGFRMGGVNQPIPLASTTPTGGCELSSYPQTYSSDSLWSYEAGSKSSFLDGHLHLDASVFYVTWKSIQQQFKLNSCAFSFVANAGDAVSKGFDLSADYLLGPVQFSLLAAYTDAKDQSRVVVDGKSFTNPGDAIGQPPNVNTPFDLTFAVQYNFNLSDMPGYVRAEEIFHSHNPGPFNSFDPTSGVYQPDLPANPDTNRLDVRAAITAGRVEYDLYVNNLLNSHPHLYRFTDLRGGTLFVDQTFRPLTVGLSAAMKF